MLKYSGVVLATHLVRTKVRVPTNLLDTGSPTWDLAS